MKTYNVKLKLLNIVPDCKVSLQVLNGQEVKDSKDLEINMYLKLLVDKYRMSDIYPDAYQTMESFPIKAFDASELIDDVSGMFTGCEALKTANLSSLELQGQNYICNGAFEDCKNLSYVKLPKCKIRGLYQTFFNCSNLETIDLSEVDMSNLNDANLAFRGCSSLKNIIGAINMISSNALSFNGAFKGCNNLKGLKIKNPIKEFLEHNAETGLNKAGLRKDQYEIVEDMEWKSIVIDTSVDNDIAIPGMTYQYYTVNNSTGQTEKTCNINRSDISIKIKHNDNGSIQEVINASDGELIDSLRYFGDKDNPEITLYYR